MRVEPYSIGSYLHIVKRGARGVEIVRDDSDRFRFLRILFLLNDKHFDKEWTRCELDGLFSRPLNLPPRVPIVNILAYTLMPNHIHLIIEEIEEGGTTIFMKRLGQSMTNHANEKYEEKGSLWQGSYRSRTVESDEYLRYLAAYVMVKNTFELYPEGGLEAARDNFEKVWEWSSKYNFSSLGDYAGYRKNSPILDQNLFEGVFKTPKEFKHFSKDMILGRLGELIPENNME